MLYDQLKRSGSLVLYCDEIFLGHSQVFKNLDELMIQKHLQRLLRRLADFHILPALRSNVLCHTLANMQLLSVERSVQ
jgi:hypothetical protein